MSVTTTNSPAQMPHISPLQKYKLRWKRRRWLWRAFRARHDLTQVTPLKSAHRPGALLGFLCVRNEIERIAHVIDYYRTRGVDHFYIVDNASDDGTADWLKAALDVTLWHTEASYRASKFGIDWINWLLTRYGHGHWCLTVDADELLVFMGDDQRNIPDLTRHLDEKKRSAFGALMLDLYPQSSLGTAPVSSDPLEILDWFDPAPYRSQRQSPMGNLWVQGGPRDRVFFSTTPQKAPTLNKLPLVRWRRGMVYVNSTHAMLPRPMNMAYDGPGGEIPSGALLHTKFLPEIVDKSAQERHRAQHFHTPAEFAHYYDQIEAEPTLWHPESVRYQSPKQLADLSLITPCDWAE